MFVTEMMKTDLVAVNPETKLSEAKSLMEKGNFRHLPVMDAEGKLVGIVTESDLLGKLVEGHATMQSKVAEVMFRKVRTVNLNDEARSLAREIARNDRLAVRLTKQALNRACEIPRMREALEHALEIDVEIESTETEESREFNEILRRDGARAAIAWRDARLG